MFINANVNVSVIFTNVKNTIKVIMPFIEMVYLLLIIFLDILILIYYKIYFIKGFKYYYQLIYVCIKINFNMLPAAVPCLSPLVSFL